MMVENVSVTADMTSSRPRAVMRREPVQRRSAARVAAILDACAALLDEFDYDELTTSKIADRARVPIGSLYQYFPDKRAVVQALTMRNLEAFSTEVERIFTGAVPAGWREAVDRVIDAYLLMLDQVPGFRRIRFGDVVDSRLLDPEDDNDAMIAARLSRLFSVSYRVPNSEELRLAFWMVVEVTDALIKLALRLSGDQRRTALATTRRLVAQILGQHLDCRLT